MPDKDTKKNQQENTTPAPIVSTTQSVQPIVAPDNMVGEAQVLGPSESEKAITKSYDDSISQLGLTIKDLEGRKAQAQQQDEVAQRRSRNMQMIAGISDGLASLANLIGVGQGGTNINMGTGALTPLQQRVEAARLERKADIKDIDERLEQYQRQLDQMKMQKGVAISQQRDKDKAFAFEQARHAEDMLMKRAALAYQKERDKVEDAYKDKNLSETIRHNKANEDLSQKEIDARKDIAKTNAEADVTKTMIRYGNPTSKDTTRFVMDDPTTGKMRTINIGDRSLNNILATYLPQAVKNGEITADEAEDAKNWRSNEVSKTNLLGMVNKSKTMRMALLSAVGEEPEGSAPTTPQGASWQDAYPDPSQK